MVGVGGAAVSSPVSTPGDREGSARSALRWNLVVVAIFKDEERYLEEWLAFCLCEGVEHVLLYDHCSTDDSRKLLEPWIEAGIVELIEWDLPWKNGAQAKAYADALVRLRGRTRWAAFIDIDEYLFSPTGRPLPDILQEYEGHAGI